MCLHESGLGNRCVFVCLCGWTASPYSFFRRVCVRVCIRMCVFVMHAWCVVCLQAWLTPLLSVILRWRKDDVRLKWKPNKAFNFTLKYCNWSQNDGHWKKVFLLYFRFLNMVGISSERKYVWISLQICMTRFFHSIILRVVINEFCALFHKDLIVMYWNKITWSCMGTIRVCVI